MRGRRRGFPRKSHAVLAAMLGVAVAGLPAVASSASEPTIEAAGNGYSFYWSPSSAEVTAGGAVTFSNTSAYEHGVVWAGGPTTPSCQGVPVFKTVGEGGALNWKGSCTFSQAGSYTFYCSVHGSAMSGTITVGANGNTTVTTGSTTTGTTNTTTATTPPPSAEESPLAGNAAQALKLVKSQHGGSVRGSIDVSKAGSGGRLEVDVFAASATIARTSGARGGRTRVGRLTRSSVAAGVVPFSVKLDAKARRALKRRHLLGLTVRITLTPHDGKALTITRVIVEHG